MNSLLLLSAFLLVPRAASAAELDRAALEKRAGAEWDAAHDKTRPKRAAKQKAEVEALFALISSLEKIGSFDPPVVAEKLGLKVPFQVTRESKYFNTYEARLESGSVRRVEVRVGADKKSGFLYLAIDPALGITPGELIDRFGSTGIVHGSPHGPPDSEYLYIYPRPGGELRLAVKPGKVHILTAAIWDDKPL